MHPQQVAYILEISLAYLPVVAAVGHLAPESR